MMHECHVGGNKIAWPGRESLALASAQLAQQHKVTFSTRTSCDAHLAIAKLPAYSSDLATPQLRSHRHDD